MLIYVHQFHSYGMRYCHISNVMNTITHVQQKAKSNFPIKKLRKHIYDTRTLGELMNICQGLLNALQVSTPEIERLIGIARRAGALGAKLTGGGGGGAVIALCDDNAADVQTAMERQGFHAMTIIGGGES